MLGFETTKFSKLLHSHSNRRSLFGLALILSFDFPEEGAFFSRKCHTWKDWCYGWSELSRDNGTESPVPARGVSAIRPKLVLFWDWVRKNLFVFLLFCSTSIPSFTQHTADPGQPRPNANDLETCCYSAPCRVPSSVSVPAPIHSRAAIDAEAAARLCLCRRGQRALKKIALSSGYSKQSL